MSLIRIPKHQSNTSRNYRLNEHLLGFALVVLSLLATITRPESTFTQFQRILAEHAVTQPKQLTSTTDTPQNKYVIYMTTHMSEDHIQFLTQCWPAALQTLSLLQQADFVVYTSLNETSPYNPLLYDTLKTPHNQVLIHRYDQGHYGSNWRLQKQEGAVLAMVDPFLSSNWFDGYEWVLRLNPDVLIRRDKWLLQTMHNPNVDAIFVDWRRNFRHKFPQALHSDFYAFRPKAVNGTAWIEFYQHQKKNGKIHAESHVYAGVEHIMEQGRMAWLPNVTGNFRFARTGGPHCDVVHSHDILQSCPNYFEAPV
jgi:hypothetical protein